ncbi:MAG: PD-(D/E)XK nuclease-like domain-containing protein [Parcubacteria group bacterium]
MADRKFDPKCPTISVPGIYADVPMDIYVGDPCPSPSVSTSVVKALSDRSPLHAYNGHPRLGGKSSESSRADLGSAAHAVLLGGAERIVVVDAADWRTKAAQLARDEAREAGRIPILAAQSDPILKMAASARAMLEFHGLNDLRAERTLLWEDARGVWCRSRPDLMHGEECDPVIDYKTSTNADPMTWMKTTLFRGGYDCQSGLVLRGLDKLLGQQERQFLFLVQEIEEPFACSLVGCGPSIVSHATQKVEAAIDLWYRCLKSGKFPGYDTRIHWAELPAYTQSDWYERQQAYGEDEV